MAHHLAKANLKSIQNSMKQRYDRNPKFRFLNPEDKVMVLELVPGHTLKARFMEEMQIISKISYLNYAVAPINKSKSSKLYYINQIKAYTPNNVFVPRLFRRP